MRREVTIDWVTILLYLFLTVAGWINVYSTSGGTDVSPFDLDTYHGKQLLFIGVSFVLGIIILALDTKFTEFISYGVFGLTMLALVGVLFVGKVTKGATSWFQVGGFSLQPAEFAKIATLMALGKFMSRYNFSLGKLYDVLIAGGMVLFPMMIILLQNDAGSALVFASMIFIFFREGMNPLIMVAGIIVALVAVISLLTASIAFSWIIILGVLLAVAIVSFVLLRGRFLGLHVAGFVFLAVVALVPSQLLKDYQRLRIEVLVASEEEIGQSKDLQKVAYNLRESMVAIGSGGLTGKGYGNATHTRGDFVPEEHTDYIFCVVGEEHGWIGSAAVLVAFFLLIWRIIFMAENSKSKYARIYGYGVASILFFHVFINVGMTIGLVPTVGIPLPFFSYGGSSFIAFSCMVFMMINHYAYRVNILGDKDIQ
ncbi:MAG: rod shape-determining protein RodA [Bacteroidia bacterium]|nr:rod shape-determining protein RodA [Bacteroidia bacterium]